jgi:hypothetical protein
MLTKFPYDILTNHWKDRSWTSNKWSLGPRDHIWNTNSYTRQLEKASLDTKSKGARVGNPGWLLKAKS